MTGVRLRLMGYGATVFAAAGLLMVLEIVVARLLAPYVGVSLYTWTSIIGVILAGLSLGNWLGGVWADRSDGTPLQQLPLLTDDFVPLDRLVRSTVLAAPD